MFERGLVFATRSAPDGTMALIRDTGRRQTVEYSAGHVLLDVQSAVRGGISGAYSTLVAPRRSPPGHYLAYFDLRQPEVVVTRVLDRTGTIVTSSPPFPDRWGRARTSGDVLWHAASDTANM